MRLRSLAPAAAVALLGATLFLDACGGSDGGDGLGPGGVTYAGNVFDAMTNGDDSLGGITVSILGDRESTGVTGGDGQFRVSSGPTGDVTVFFRRGGCEGSFPLGSIASRSTLSLLDVIVDCDSATVGQIVEDFEAVLRDEPATASSLQTCIRAGSDERLRNVDGSGASYELSDGTPVSSSALRDDDRLRIVANRGNTGAPGPVFATRIVILERDVNDPCDDDPLT